MIFCIIIQINQYSIIFSHRGATEKFQCKQKIAYEAEVKSNDWNFVVVLDPTCEARASEACIMSLKLPEAREQIPIAVAWTILK